MTEILVCPHCLNQAILVETEHLGLQVVFVSRQGGFSALDDVAKRLQRIGVPMTQQEYNTLASQIARTSLPETGLLPASGGQLHRQLIVQLGQVFREVELLRHQMSCQNRTVT
jgi:hypothetical protein